MPVLRCRMSGCVPLGFALILSTTAWAGAPADELKGQTDRVLSVLQDPRLKGPEHRARRQDAIRTAMEALIDFGELSRRVLGAAWAARTPAEREEFTGAFSEFLKTAYANQIDLYRGEKLLHDGERVEDDLAIVRTRIEWLDGDKTPVDFRMLRGVDDRWGVYDVSVDGVSILENYHAQFRSLLRRGTFEDLMKRIKGSTGQRR